MTDAVPTRGQLSRFERFSAVGSTNDIVREWLLDATPEVCLAVADQQAEGRGRHGRTWTAPPGAALLLSLGFRPTWLAPDRAWRLAGTAALAMCDAAEETAGLPVGAVRMKWPNDLVVETGGPRALLAGDLTPNAARARLAAPLELRKLAGVLGESDGLGTDDPRVVVGIGVNVDWARDDFPPDIAPTMTSLRDAAGGRPVDREALLASFVDHLDARLAALRAGYFDIADWTGRQATTGRLVTLESGDGAAADRSSRWASTRPRAPWSSRTTRPRAAERRVVAGEVVRVRLAPVGV